MKVQSLSVLLLSHLCISPVAHVHPAVSLPACYRGDGRTLPPPDAGTAGGPSSRRATSTCLSVFFCSYFRWSSHAHTHWCSWVWCILQAINHGAKATVAQLSVALPVRLLSRINETCITSNNSPTHPNTSDWSTINMQEKSTLPLKAQSGFITLLVVLKCKVSFVPPRDWSINTNKRTPLLYLPWC